MTAPDTTPPAAARAGHGGILRSTAVIGLSSVISILISIVRMKAMAVLLGPAGLGIMMLFNALLDVATNLAGLGIASSGVRQIAQATGTGDKARIALTVAVLRWTALGLGVAGAIVVALAAAPLSWITFGRGDMTAGIVLLAAAVFFRVVGGAYGALLQGVRRIADLARTTILGAVVSTIVAVPLIYLFGERGIPVVVVIMAAVGLLINWWFSRGIELAPFARDGRAVRGEAASLVKLGVAFMLSGFLTVGGAYLVRVLVLHQVGAEGAGLYQSAWTVAGLYAGFLLQAMGMDFYPRLTALAHDPDAANQVVNEQAQISILLAGPGVIATMTFAPLILTVMYSPEFASAIGLLRWVCLGVLLQVVSWPVGYIVLAKGARTTFIVLEVVATALHVGLAWLLVGWVGLDGAGMAFFGMYIVHTVLVVWVGRRLTGFTWTRENLQTGAILLPLSLIVFGAFQVLPLWQATVLGTAVLCGFGLYALRELARLVPDADAALLPKPFRALWRLWTRVALGR